MGLGRFHFVMRRLGALLLLLACREHAIAPAVIAPIPSASAAPVAVKKAPESFTYEAFTSTDQNEYVGWQVLLARRDDGNARVVVRSRGSGGSLPVELAGTTTWEHKRLHVRAAAGSAKDALRFDALIDGDDLRGVVRADSEHEDVTAKRGVPTLEPTFQMPLGGDIAGKRVDIAWDQRGTNVKARVTDVAGSRELEGVMRDGRFVLEGSGVMARGIFSSLTAGIGEWIESGQSQPMTLDSVRVDLPPKLVLGNVQITATDRWVRGASGCPSSYDVYPEVHGLDWKTEVALDKLLGPGASASTTCTGQSDLWFLGAVWSTTTYAVTASRAGWFAIRRSAYSYAGGAHGMSGETCDVALLASGRVGSLQSELPAASLAKLGALVRKTILASAPGKSLVDLGFKADDPDITNDRVICVVDDHGALALEIVYQDMDPAGMSRFIDARPRIPAAAVRSLFPGGSLGALVFQ